MTPTEAAQFDLTRTHAKFLDLHLTLPLIEFIQKRKLYSDEDILKSRIELLEKTNMVQFLSDEYQHLHGHPLPDLEKRKANVISELNQRTESVQPLLSAIQTATTRGSQVTAEVLAEDFQITNDQIESLFDLAKYHFSVANYDVARNTLIQYQALSSNQDHILASAWGHLAAMILGQHWEAALEDLNKLKDLIDRFPAGVSQLQQCAWLVHWSLFVFFNHPSGRTGITDLFFQDRYLNAIQTVAPHMIRYLTAAVIINKKPKIVPKDLVRLIQQERYSYQDPVTQFVECLFVNYDFESAQQKLRECETILSNDYFLVSCRDEFLESARMSIFETYCRIHQCIDLQMLSEKLNLRPEEAEVWIVNLICNARLDAKIDSQANHVIMGSQPPSAHQQVIDQTQNLLFRSYVMVSALEKLESAAHAK